MSETDQLAQLKTSLEVMKDRAEYLVSKIRQTKETLQELEQTHKILVGHGWGIRADAGQIGSLTAEIVTLKRLITDRTKTKVIWKVAPRYDQGDYIIDSVSEKRIAVKKIGLNYRQQFNRDGTTVAKNCQEVIDIRATFRET